MTVRDKIRKAVQNFLRIKPAGGHPITVEEHYDFEANAFRNRMWYRGDPYELEQFFKNCGHNNAMFWSAVPQRPIRKIHSGLPSMMISVMSAIVCRDYNSMVLSERSTEWEEVAKDNDFPKLLRKAIDEAIIVGDGAFKISNDPSLSDCPILEFFPGDRVEYVYRRGRLQEIVFRTQYTANNKIFYLYEHYGWGYIKYVLRDAQGDPVPLDTLQETTGLFDVGLFGYEEDKDGQPVDSMGKPAKRSKVMLAVPFMIKTSSKWEGRGESLIDKKDSDFDALDEVISQWADAVRSARPTKYVPEILAPIDANGVPIAPNAFDNAYMMSRGNLSEGANNKIEVVQPVIASENYLASYITFLDLCLQGFMSPSTLGIDTKKLDNADAQREKEKTTLYTRNLVIEALEKVLPKLVNAVIYAIDAFGGKAMPSVEIKVEVKFGEYASPSFEALVEVLGKAKTAGLMSIETIVDELYGDSKDDRWKAAEVLRLKEEIGIAQMPPEDEGLDNIAIDETTDPAAAAATQLNGAQITSMMGIIKSVKAGDLSRANAISIITSTLGVSREAAETFMDDQTKLTKGAKKNAIPIK